MVYLLGLVVAIIGCVIGFLISRIFAKKRLRSAEGLARRMVDEAKREAENYRKEAELALKEEWYKEKMKFDSDTQTRRKDLDRLERKLAERELVQEKREHILSEREVDLIKREKNLQLRERIIKTKTERLDQLISEENQKLARIANMTQEEAKVELMRNLEAEARLAAAVIIKEIKEKAHADAEKEAKEIIIRAIQRCAFSHWAETTVSVVPLPLDEMKGRIIGREGRNIRTFETLTGAEVVIDDTPGAVIISAFDPIRREIAKIAMERLVSDGRIHPARIEEVITKTKSEMDSVVKDAGEGVVLELGIVGLHSDLVRYLGLSKYRTSYGQNLLQHAKEVAYLSNLLAQELELDTMIAKRAGLLHDVGKATDQNWEGPHALVGAEIARRCGESEIVVNAIAAHHEEASLESPYAFLVLTADSISGGRPGARRETFEAYIKRLDNLEAIATGFDGVDKAYAIQAGRELRVLVEPAKVTDLEAQELAVRVASRIQQELKYPGQIKVMVIRETRAIDYAK